MERKKEKKEEVIPIEIIEHKIFLIRGQRVMFDADLAKLYTVSVKRLNEQVKRNKDRFPTDFMFQLTVEESENLRSQFATSSLNYGGRRYKPYAFTEHGVAMLSSVLNSPRAVEMNIFIIRAFIKLREMLLTHKDLAQKMEDLERQQKENTDQITAIRSVLTKLVTIPPPQETKPIGFDMSRVG